MNTNFATSLGRMAQLPVFFVYVLTWNAGRNKFEKKPIGSPAHARMTFTQACDAVARMRAVGLNSTVGLWIDTTSNLFFVDIDALPADYTADERATRIWAMFPGAYVSWSTSKRGLHIVGTLAAPVPHSSRSDPLHLEFYTRDRGIALAIDQQPIGSMDSVHDVSALVAEYFPARAATTHTGDGVRLEYRGPFDDDTLIQRFMSARLSAAAAFNGKASLPQLWRGEVSKDSEHDMALASHLSWWCGGNAERVERLMRRSGMVRPKWDERRGSGTYLSATVARACELSESCYVEPQAANDADETSAASLTTELSNAYRLRDAHGHNMIAVPGVGWHVRGEAGPWTQDDHAASRLAFGLGVAIKAEADGLSDWVYQATLDGLGLDECKRRADVQKNRYGWAKSSESKAVIDHSLSLAERLLSVSADKLDASPLLVGTPSGVIDLTTCTVREHRRDDYITKRIACDYDPAARAPTWDPFVAEIMAHDAELIAYLQTLCGYILSGVRGEHVLPVFHGTGANGKSTFLSALQTLLGDYAGTAAPGLLITRGGSEHPTGLASLQGRRLVVVSETGEGGRLAEEEVKQLTGGDRITARRMRQDFYEFEPSHIIVLQTNHKPRVTGTDEGIWRRMKLVPFNVTVPSERRDANLPQKLVAESPGILAWCVDGWRKYQAVGFREPAAVRGATADYRSDSDHVGSFIADRCNLAPELTTPASAIYLTYKGWCAENGEHPLTQRSLGLRLAERPGIVQTRTNQSRTWRGLGIASHVVSAPSLTLVRS